MRVDSRGVERGKCIKCDCEEYAVRGKKTGRTSVATVVVFQHNMNGRDQRAVNART